MTPTAFVLESERCLMTTDAQSIPFVLLSANTPWFRAAEVAIYLIVHEKSTSIGRTYFS